MHDACKQHQGKTTADRGSLRDPGAVGTAFAKKAISHLGCGLLTLPSWRRPRGSQTVREAEQLRIPSISHLGLPITRSSFTETDSCHLNISAKVSLLKYHF